MENPDNENFQSQYALSVAYKTMTERCQRLEKRLATVEDENVRLRLDYGGDERTTRKFDERTKSMVQTLQERVEELTKEKSQLTHHLFMVAEENRQLWSRLTKSMRTNQTLDGRLTRISDTLKPRGVEFGGTEGERSLEEISLRLIDNIMLEKSNLERQCEEMAQIKNDIGFTYPIDPDTDSTSRSQPNDLRLSEIKDTLLRQQIQLKNALQNFTRHKKGPNVQSNDASTQFDTEEIPKLQTDDDQTCPMCGLRYGESISFTDFHEHVVNHFA